MIVYLVNKETKEIKDTYYNVILFTENSVTFDNNGFLGKIFCDDNEIFIDDIEKLDTDHLDEIESEELENNFN